MATVTVRSTIKLKRCVPARGLSTMDAVTGNDQANDVLRAVAIPPQLLDRLLDMDPEGAYGISYDVFTWKTEDDPPAGWNANRCELMSVTSTLTCNLQFCDSNHLY